jgi:hypothetical protein
MSQLKFEVSVVVARDMEPLIPRDIVRKEMSSEKITIKVMDDVYTGKLPARLGRIVGRVVFVDGERKPIAFYVESMNMLVIAPELPEEVVASMVEKIRTLKKLEDERKKMFKELIKLAAIAIVATTKAEGFAVSPDKVEICGVDADILVEVDGLNEIEKAQECLKNAIRKILGIKNHERVRAGGLTF